MQSWILHAPCFEFSGPACLLALLGQLVWISVLCASSPKSDCVNELTRQYPMNKALERWELERNPISTPAISASAIRPTDEPVADIPACGFKQPVFWRRADEILVDARLFTDLRSASAREARKLGPEGTVVGRVLDAKHDSRQLVKLLVLSGVVDANWHVVATVSLMEEGRDSHGYWARLVSDDRYWTNRENRVLYDFAIRISPQGEIRLMHVNHVAPPAERKP